MSEVVVDKIDSYEYIGVGDAYKINGTDNRIKGLLLCFFLGCFGIHRFYVGKIATGILWLFTLGFLGIGIIIDLICIAVPNKE